MNEWVLIHRATGKYYSASVGTKTVLTKDPLCARKFFTKGGALHQIRLESLSGFDPEELGEAQDAI